MRDRRRYLGGATHDHRPPSDSGALTPVAVLAKDILSGDIRAAARLMRDLDDEIPAAHRTLKALYRHTGRACILGITGAPGVGKSTLVEDVLYRRVARELHRARTVPGDHDSVEGLERVDKVIDVDQSPIGRTPRSNPATYTGVFTPIRQLFSRLPEARIRGYGPGRFSFNVKGGRCEACRGDGLVKIEMHFLPDVYVPCEICKGARFNRDTLDIEFKGKNIADVLDMPIAEAVEFFGNQPGI
ncbi:MAG: hypothetical protein R3239_08120, partial [Thermodesulfobacteriota bacterium]|nr:hypothetical protein [Thermodesulfobacteriota bacterium]